MAIELTEPERALLAEMLDKELEDVRSEFHHTQAHDYRDKLKAREDLVRGLLARLRS